MGFIKEFREFAMKGNVVDLAVGVIIGGAFGTIVKSMIDDILMPVVGKAIGNVDFSNLYIPLSDTVTQAEAAKKAPLSLAEAKSAGAVLAYGNFITILINFVILAFCIFIVVKLMNEARKRFERQEAAAPPPPPPAPAASEIYLKEIRDLLAKR